MSPWMRFGWLLTLCCGAALGAARAAAPPLLTELSSSHVKIATGFTGQHVFIYGSTLRASDIVIRVTSPDESMALLQRRRIGPFWLNGPKLIVSHVPGLVYLLTSRPLAKIAERPVLERNGLTFHAALAAAQTKGGPSGGYRDWQAAFERLKESQGLFRRQDGAVRVDGGRLFSVDFPLPATLPIGRYRLDIYAFRDGEMVAHQSRVLVVNEIGLERWISRVAEVHSWLFGVLFTLFAFVLGLSLSMLLRRR